MSRRLEKEPLEEGVFIVPIRYTELVLLVVFLEEVEEDRVGLPNYEVIVLVVDEGRDTAIWVQLRVLGRFLLELGEVEVDALVRESELLEDERDLPVNSMEELSELERR